MSGTYTGDSWPESDLSVDTLAFLQEEIERLEAEVRARDESARHASPLLPEPDSGEEAESLRRAVAELTTEVSSRDEAIGLLLEQTRLFEEGVAANREEWEQLHRWLAQVEQRVETQSETDGQAAEQLRAEQRRYDALARQAEADRREWQTRQKGFESEITRLRGLAANGDALQAMAALEAENQELRDANAYLQEALAQAGDVQDNRQKLDEALARQDDLAVQARKAEDRLLQERIEHEAALSAARSQLAQLSLAQAQDNATARPEAIEADERIRAFRQHLRELHDQEAEARERGGLASRLSRLWRQTGPAR